MKPAFLISDHVGLPGSPARPTTASAAGLAPFFTLTTRWGRLLALLALLLPGSGAWAQTVRTLPGSYSSFSQAILDINTNFASGGVTVNVAANYTETAPAGGLPLLTAQGTAGAGQIIFQKSGTGANPLITAGVGNSATLDGIVRLSGASYVTFDGIDLLDPSSNNTQTTATEYGYGFFRATATTGCQNNTIQNCTVTLNRAGSSSTAGIVYGIYLAQTTATGTSVTPTTAAGSNSGNKFYSNTILNTQLGIYANGYTAPAPYTLADQNNDFGGTAATTGNTIRNFGGMSNLTGYGMRLVAQSAVNASYNTVDNAGGGGVAAPNGVSGVYAEQGQSGDCTLNNNQVTLLQAANASTGTATGVYAGHTGTGTISLLNNVVGYTTTATITAGTNPRILVQSVGGSGIGALNVTGNQLTYNLSSTGAGGLDKAAQGVNCSGTVTGVASISNNLLTYNVGNSGPGTIAAAGSAYIGFNIGVTTANLAVDTNTVAYTLTNTDSSGKISAASQAIVLSSTVSGTLSVSGNVISYTVPASPATVGTLSGAMLGIFSPSAVPGNLVVSNNTISYDITNGGAAITSTIMAVASQGVGIGGTTSLNGNTVNFQLATSAGTTSSSLTGITNSAPLTGAASFDGNTVNFQLATSAGTTSSSLTGITNSGLLTGAATMSNNTLTYTGTNTGSTFSSSLTGVRNSGDTASTLTIDNNTLLNSSTTSTGFMTIIQSSGTSTGLLTISNNRYQNSSTATTATTQFISTNAATANVLVQGNTLSGITRSAAGGTFYGYYGSSNSSTGTATADGNSFTGVTLTGATPFIGIYYNAVIVTAQTLVATNNIITGIAAGTSTSYGIAATNTVNTGPVTITGNTIGFTTVAAALTGISVASQSGTATISNNTISLTSTAGTCLGINGFSTVPQIISGNTITGISGTASITGIVAAGTSTQTVSQNTVTGLRGTTGAVTGLSVPAGTTNTITGNKLADFALTGASTITGLAVSGGTTTTLANNLVGDLRAPAATSLVALAGLAVSGSPTVNAYYNSIYLNATGGATFGTSGIYLNSTSATLDARNNLVVNLSTAAGTGGYTAALRRVSGTTGTPPANYARTSNNNLLYAGTPSTTRLLYVEGTTTATNATQTLFAYRKLMYTAPGSASSSSSREQQASSQPVTFGSTTGTATNFLLPNASAPIESGAQPLGSISTDYAGITRSSTPDQGAYEGSYTYVDVVAPGIAYTPLADTGSPANRTLTGVVIADVAPGSGVNGSSGTRPRLYYKRSTDTNAYNGNTNATAGWKYVEASGSTSPFSFTIDYSLLPTAPTANTIIQYFVVAQDGAATPNVALNAGTFAAQPASVALSSAAFPIGSPLTPSGSTLNQYQIVPLPTALSVGTGQTYTSLTNAGGLFDAINSGVLAGNTTATITSDLTAETGAVALGPLPDSGNNYTLTVQSDGTLRNITGSATNATGLVRLAGANRVTFDGQQPTGNKSLLFSNTTADVPTFSLTADASNNTLTWLIAESANTSAASGTIVLGSGTTTGNNNNQCLAVDIRSTNGATTATYANGIYSAGLSSTAPNGPDYVYNSTIHNFSGSAVNLAGSNNSGWAITGNSLYQEAARSTPLIVVQAAGGNSHTVSNNNIYQTAGTNSAAFTGIYLSGGGTGHTVSGNYIGGTSSGASGGTMTVGSSSGNLNGIALVVGTTPATSVQGNVIRAITNAGTSSFSNGINVGGGAVNIGTVSSNIIGDASPALGLKVGYGYGIYVSTTAAATIANNQVLNLQTNPGLTTGVLLFGIYATGTGAAPVVRDNTISGLVNNSTPNATRNAQTVGIFTAATGAVTITGNQLSNIGNTSTATPTATFYHYVSGIYVTGAASGSLVARNRVTGLYSSSTGTGSLADRILLLYNDGTGTTVANNQFSSAGATAAAPNLYGLYENGTGNTYAYNAVYLAGTGSANTYALYRNGTGAGLSIRNNILSNERTGSGSNYAIGVGSATNFVGAPASPATNTSDYNLFLASNAATVGLYGATSYAFATWKTATGGDGSSLSETTATVPAASLFTNTSTGDLAVNPANSMAWYANGTGTQLPAVGTDYSSAARPTTVAAGAPDIGSTEITPTSTPPALAVSGAPGLGGTQTFSLGGRTLAQLTYGNTGTVPTSVTGRYYSGTNPPAPFAASARYANAYFAFNNDNADGSGYTYQPTLTYDPALLGTITSEADQRLSQRNADNSGYRPYATTVNPSPVRTLIVPNGLTYLNILAVGDQAAPLPVQLVRFEAQRQGQDAALSWTTASELNNKGFEVQVSTDGQHFRSLDFVPGAGSSQAPRNYSYLDREGQKAGLRYYRLRQLDHDAQEFFSPVRTVQFDAPGLLVQAAPNPFDRTLALYLTLPAATPTASLTLTDALGQLVLRQELGPRPAGASAATVTGISDLPAGVYMLRVQSALDTQVLKVVKQ